MQLGCSAVASFPPTFEGVQGDFSARPLRRLGSFCMTYGVLATLVATLAPFRFAWPRHFAFNLEVRQFDVVLNLLLLFPLGFLFRLTRRSRDRHCLDALVLGAAFSTAIELLQMFVPSRCASPFDIAANTVGAFGGALLHREIGAWFDRRALEQLRTQPPLAILLYLLLPALWLDGLSATEPTRVLLSLPLGLAGAFVAVSLSQRGAAAGAEPASPARITLLVCGWFALGSLPALLTAPRCVGLCLLCIAGATRVFLWRARSSGPCAPRATLSPLGQCAPLLFSYLLGAALWPLRWSTAFHWTAGFPPFQGCGCDIMLAFLEYAGAFTLLGYILAELAASSATRSPMAFGRFWPTAGALALSLELVRGFSAGHGASLLSLALLALAASSGGVLHRVLSGVGRTLAGPPSTREGHASLPPIRQSRMGPTLPRGSLRSRTVVKCI
jgi:VanZ family protein